MHRCWKRAEDKLLVVLEKGTDPLQHAANYLIDTQDTTAKWRWDVHALYMKFLTQQTNYVGYTND